jgi:hypothetical protein
MSKINKMSVLTTGVIIDMVTKTLTDTKSLGIKQSADIEKKIADATVETINKRIS